MCRFTDPFFKGEKVTQGHVLHKMSWFVENAEKGR